MAKVRAAPYVEWAYGKRAVFTCLEVRWCVLWKIGVVVCKSTSF